MLRSVLPTSQQTGRVRILKAILLAVVLGFSARSEASTISSVNSGAWSDPAVWSGGQIPQTGDDVTISSSTTVRLDANSAVIHSLQIDGTLLGGQDTLFVRRYFLGSGAFTPESGKVLFCDTLALAITNGALAHFHDLILGDSLLGNPSAVAMDVPLTIDRDLTIALVRDTLASVTGSASISLFGSFLYRGASSPNWTGTIVMRGVKDSLGRHDTVVRFYAGRITKDNSRPFFFPQVIVDKPDSLYSVQLATHSVIEDTLILSGVAGTPSILVRAGTLEQRGGLTLTAGAVRPLIEIGPGARYRTELTLTPRSATDYDSTNFPLFQCDTNSTFEYWSDRLELEDVTYLANNLVGHSYSNLVLSKMIASFRNNPITIRDTLVLQDASSIIPSARFGNTNGSSTQRITIKGAMINQNTGESGAPGSIRGCGMQSLEKDVWIFEGDSVHGKDTCYWSGPSQVNTVVVRSNTVLSVRFINDRAGDSLDVLDSLIEEGGVCGGHLIGRVFSEVPRVLDQNHITDNVGNFGLTITSGTQPYVGKVRVVRTSGYTPPGITRSEHAIRRYYNVVPEHGPQRGLLNTLRFTYHCDEVPEGTLFYALKFWRSRDRGSAWAESGRTGYDSIDNIYTRDTTIVGYPNGSNGFYWTLADGYTDYPVAVELRRFSISPKQHGNLLQWSTGSEYHALGFEIERTVGEKRSTIATYVSDPELIARGRYGAEYSYLDDQLEENDLASDGLFRYTLYEVSLEGLREDLGTRTAAATTPSSSPSLRSEAGEITLELISPVSDLLEYKLHDVLGREVSAGQVPLNAGSNHVNLPAAGSHGAVWVELSSSVGRWVERVVVMP